MSEIQDEAYNEACDEIERLRESLHEAGARNGTQVLQLREKDLVIATMNEAHKLLIAEKDAEIKLLKEQLKAAILNLARTAIEGGDET